MSYSSEGISIPRLLQSTLKRSKIGSLPSTIDTLNKMLEYRQKLNYRLQTQDGAAYIRLMWYEEEKKFDIDPLSTNMFHQHLATRLKNVYDDLKSGKITIKKRIEEENKNIQIMREEKEEEKNEMIFSNTKKLKQKESKALNTKNRTFNYQEFVKKNKRQKQQRQKMLDEDLKKREEKIKLKLKEQTQKIDKLREERKNRVISEHQFTKKRRKQQQIDRIKRNQQYQHISKLIIEKPPLFKKWEEKYSKMYEQQEKKRNELILTERKSMYQQLSNLNLEEHELRYDEWKKQQEDKRKQRLEDSSKMMSIYEQQIGKYHHLPLEKIVYEDQKEEERVSAREKKKLMKNYVMEVVKEKHKPKINYQKRQELNKLIKLLDGKAKRKIKMPDGSEREQEVKPKDSRLIGLQNLSKVKKIVEDMKRKKRNSNYSSVNSKNHQQESKNFQKKTNYLQQLRENNHRREAKSVTVQMIESKSMTFEQKFKKVEAETQKLADKARLSEKQLRYGKFFTSEDILNHLQDIDQKHTDIIHLKLKLMKHK